MAGHVEKFLGFTFLNPKIIAKKILNLKPILTPLVKKLLRELPSPVGCVLSHLGHSLAHVKI